MVIDHGSRLFYVDKSGGKFYTIIILVKCGFNGV